MNLYVSFLNFIIVICLFCHGVFCNTKTSEKPHIILILADDMGFNDVGYHGSDQIPTPNIDALGYLGIILNKFYAAPLCTPSRGSLLTGKYPSKLGLQYFLPIFPDEPWGLGLDEKLLPEYMRAGGYSTHLIGKWHLGHYRKAYTPTLRGFDSHLGYLSAYIDYWNHSIKNYNSIYKKEYNGLDMRNNLTMDWNTQGIYATDLFTNRAVKIIREHNTEIPLFMFLSHLAPHAGNDDDPVQAPSSTIETLNHIKDRNRRIYAAMVSKLDESVGKVVHALEMKKMLNNSVILFLSDSGAATIGPKVNYGSNYPLRGQKNSPWEGAVRSNGIIWSPLLNRRQRVSNQLIHISDWFTTFIHFANVTIRNPSEIDGLNVWDSLSNNLDSPRKEVLCNYDNSIPNGYASYILGNWKLINGSNLMGEYDGWLGDIDTTEKHTSFINYTDSILKSDVAKALLPYALKNRQGKSFNEFDIIQLRNEATVGCNLLIIQNLTNCKPLEGPCLFNLNDDPCEIHNLADQHTDKLAELQNHLQKHIRETVPIRNKPGDPRSNPVQFNNTWTWWYDELGISNAHGIYKITYFNIIFYILIIVDLSMFLIY